MQQQTVLLRMLVRLREDAGVKQTALAARLGITQSEVSKFERGERALDLLRLRAWLRALDVGLVQFADALDQELDRLARDTADGDPAQAFDRAGATKRPASVRTLEVHAQ